MQPQAVPAAVAVQPCLAARTWNGRDLVLAALTVHLALPATSAFLLDRAGLDLRATNLLLAVSVQLLLLGLALRRVRPGSRAGWPYGTLSVLTGMALTAAIGLRLAWPSLLPVSTSVDETNHWLLVDYLVRHGTLPRGDEAASLIEMADYPFGPALLVALGARAFDVSSLYLLHAAAAAYLAVFAAFVVGAVAELSGPRTAVVAVPVLLWPTAYTLGAIAHDFFLAQVYGVACLAGAAYWAAVRRRLGDGTLAPLALAGLGLLFSYPSLLPIYVGGIVLAEVRPITRRAPWRLAVVLAPIALFAAAYLPSRVGRGLDVVQQGGVATAPSFETLPLSFLALSCLGLVWTSWRADRWPIAAFAWSALGQLALFLVIQLSTGGLSRYAIEKMVYVVAPLLALVAATLLAHCIGRLSWPPRRGNGLVGAAGLAVLAVCVIQVGPRLNRPVGDRVPTSALTPDLVAASAWLAEPSRHSGPLYLTPDHLPAYWVEIGLLKRDRRLGALTRFHDRVRPPAEYWAWSASPAAPDYALAIGEAASRVGLEADLVFRSGQAAVLRQRTPPPRLSWIGDDLALIEAGQSTRRLWPGDVLRVDVQLGAVQPVVEPRAVVARLRDWSGEQRGEAVAVLDPPLSPLRRASLQLSVALDPALRPGAYRVELVTFRLPSWDTQPVRLEPGRDGPTGRLFLEPVLIAPAAATPARGATPSRVIAASFGGQIELLGVDRLVRGPDTLELDLLWRAQRAPEHDYSVFVHVLDAGGRLIAQSDGFPWKGANPTTAWEPGQPVPDSYRLPLPVGWGGPLRVIAGLYRLDTGERLPTVGGDSVELARIPP